MNNALQMFKSATIKLTAWYVSIVVVISLLYSVIIFSIATSEVGTRISSIQRTMQPDSTLALPYDELLSIQIHKAQSNLVGSLLITNICIWIAGGVGSYYLAKRTLRPIEETHEAQSRFTSDASHELRTPLASMKIELEVALRDKNITNEEMHELLQSNLEEVNKLTALSHTLLQLSRLEHGDIVHEKVNIPATIADTVQRLSPGPGRIIVGDTKPLYALANQTHVEELLTILIDNALKYSPGDSAIHITAFRQKQLAGFKITNEGLGIPIEKLPYIFDRFYRADQSRTSGDTKGYGLGLSLAKKIVELHSGSLSVTSATHAPTTFSVTFPTPSSSLRNR